MIAGYQYSGGATPTSGSGIGMNHEGAELKIAAKKAVTAEDMIYRIAAVTAAISLLATVL